MIIAIRKEPNGTIYLDKNIFSDERFKEVDLSQPPYNYTKVEVDAEYSDCIASDFNDDLTFSTNKYNARKLKQKQAVYEEKIVAKIRQKYSVNQELALLRQLSTKPEEFAEYSAYVENCKAEVKQEVF